MRWFEWWRWRHTLLLIATTGFLAAYFGLITWGHAEQALERLAGEGRIEAFQSPRGAARAPGGRGARPGGAEPDGARRGHLHELHVRDAVAAGGARGLRPLHVLRRRHRRAPAHADPERGRARLAPDHRGLRHARSE